MRRPRWAGGVLVALAAVGCTLPRQPVDRASSWLDRARGKGGSPLAADALVLQTTLIDQPAPDPYLTHDLWAAGAVTNPLPAELSALLEVNGLRVRVVSGVPPAKFLSLVGSDDATVSPMVRGFEPGKPKVVPVNGPLDRAAYSVRTDLTADAAKVEVAAAECGLSITARPGPDGRVRVTCEPQVQHGDRQTWLRPTADGTAFDRREQKSLAAYPTLGWDVVLGPDEFLIVGPTADPAGTLGRAYFYADAADRVRQRVLVVKAARPTGAPNAAAVPSRPTNAAAAQLAGRVVRGSAE